MKRKLTSLPVNYLCQKNFTHRTQFKIHKQTTNEITKIFGKKHLEGISVVSRQGLKQRKWSGRCDIQEEFKEKNQPPLQE
jgi:hypothetical protein